MNCGNNDVKKLVETIATGMYGGIVGCGNEMGTVGLVNGARGFDDDREEGTGGIIVVGVGTDGGGNDCDCCDE